VAFDPQLAFAAVAGLGGGLLLLWRGFGGYRIATRIDDTSVSRIASAAVGEVLVSGVIETAELSLVSPLQSVPCVWYRARIDASDGDSSTTDFREERAVGFRVRDDTGDLRVFPRGARFDVPTAWDEKTGPFGAEPPGLRRRSGGAFGPVAGDRDAQIAALLTVQHTSRGGYASEGSDSPFSMSLGSGRSRATRYVEARLEPGQVVTVVGRALPFDQLTDPAGADELAADTMVDDPEVAANVAAARAAGLLHDNPADAWGNAAIPGFGIGRPVREPDLHEDANEPSLAAAADATAYATRFDIPPDALVIAASDEVPLVVSLGTPSVAAGRQQGAFLVGLGGAVLAILSAMALALIVGGGLAA
jgi:hypothetical protein